MDDELRTTRQVAPDRFVRRIAALVFGAVALLALYALIQRLG